MTMLRPPWFRSRRRQALEGLEDEIRDHLDHEIETNIARGLTSVLLGLPLILPALGIALLICGTALLLGMSRTLASVLTDVPPRVTLRTQSNTMVGDAQASGLALSHGDRTTQQSCGYTTSS